jgi:acetyltransferase-like isoleucine patch superfamily enzyme
VRRRWNSLVLAASRVVRWIRWKLLALAGHERRIRALRKLGVRIGENCWIYTTNFSTEPYLVQIGNHVAISRDVAFVTHDTSGWIFEDHPEMDVYGTITVGDHTYFGVSCVVLPGTQIGSHCVIAAGSVVRGVIPDGSVVMGSPAKVVMKTPLLKQLLVNHKNRLDIRSLPPKEKEQVLRRHFGLG